MATIKEIAELAGVSRGTVDRVLNNRGSVDSRKAHNILEIAKALNYTPNRAGKALAVRKKQLKFGYILFGSTSSNPFFLDVVAGVERRAAELSEYGVSVEIRYTDIENPSMQVKLIDELIDSGINGLVLTPINHPMVIERVKTLTESGFPVVTANSDIPDSGRLAYVGSDFYNSGETAAGMMNLICGGTANVGVIMGSPLVLCHSERVAGFTNRIKEEYTGIEILATEVNYDDDIQSYVATKRLLEAHSNINALFLAAAGVVGACRAVTEMDYENKLKIICYDATETTCALIKSGVISATITQGPFEQGAKPLDILLNHVGIGQKSEQEYYFTEISIKIKDNL